MTYIVDEMGTDLYKASYQLARYRSAEPEKKPMMICPRQDSCDKQVHKRAHCRPHEFVVGECSMQCGHRDAVCIPYVAPAPQPPVREIDREVLASTLDYGRKSLEAIGEQRTYPSEYIGLNWLIDTLEALASGKARIADSPPKKASPCDPLIKPTWCAVADKQCVQPVNLPCTECADFQEAASEWARNTGWTEPR